MRHRRFSECELKLQELEEHWDGVLSNPERCARQGEEGAKCIFSMVDRHNAGLKGSFWCWVVA